MSNSYGSSPYGNPFQKPGDSSNPYQNGPQEPEGGPYQSGPTGPEVNTEPFVDPYQPPSHPSNRHQPAFVRDSPLPGRGAGAGLAGATAAASSVVPDSENAPKLTAALMVVCGLLMFAHIGVFGLVIAAVVYGVARSIFTKAGAGLTFNTVMAYTVAAIGCWVVLGIVGLVVGGDLRGTVMMVLRYGFGAGLIGLGVAAFMGKLVDHPLQVRTMR